MRPNELCSLIVKEPLVLIGLSSQKVIDIAQAYLALDSRIQKLDAVVEAAKEFTCVSQLEPWDEEAEDAYQAICKALADLEQK